MMFKYVGGSELASMEICFANRDDPLCPHPDMVLAFI